MRVGVLLSGCGVQDGSEVYETVLTILALERAGAQVVTFAPDVTQSIVYNHYRGAEERVGEGGGPRRSVLSEAGRIVRGKITSISEFSAHDMDALIIPGGFGVVRNLCTYLTEGNDASVNDEVRRLIHEMSTLGKPIGAMCIAPVLVALCIGEKAPSLTVGNDAKVAVSLQRFGASHVETGVDDIHVDTNNKIVSTPAFMIAEGPAEAEPGISKLVEKVLSLVEEI